MASLRRHTLTSDPVAHLRLGFRADCPACRAARLSGPPPPDELLSMRARASLAAGLVAASTALPMSSAVAQGPRPVGGEAQRMLPPGDVSDAAPAEPAAPESPSSSADGPPALSAPERVKPPSPATSAQPRAPQGVTTPREPVEPQATSPEPAAQAPSAPAQEQPATPAQPEQEQPEAPAQPQAPVQKAPSPPSEAAPREPIRPQATSPEPPSAQAQPGPSQPARPRSDAPAADHKQGSQSQGSPADGTERRTSPVAPSGRGAESRERQLPSGGGDAAAAVQGAARAHARAGSPASGEPHETVVTQPGGAERRSDTEGTTSKGSGSSGAPAAADGRQVHVVRAGESLWLIAEQQLGDGASNARIAAEVARLWERNADRIGTGDPDLIHPGQELRL